jgi:uncharacterized membrane protein YhfC
MLGAGHGGAEAIILGLLAGFALLQSAPAGQGLMPLLGTAERIFALADHLALSVLVLQVFVGGRWHWLVIAIGWHGLLDGVTFYASRHVSTLAVEGILAGFGVVSVAIVVALRRPPSAVTRS